MIPRIDAANIREVLFIEVPVRALDLMRDQYWDLGISTTSPSRS